MARTLRGGIAVLTAVLAGSAWADAAAYDELPPGSAAHVAQFYYSALALPDVDGWDRERRLALLDAATERHRDRLVDRASWASAEAALRHVERLAASGAATRRAVEQACARYGLVEGGCSGHAGYVRRVLVVEEMLAQGRVTLDGLETELAGAPRRRLSDAR